MSTGPFTTPAELAEMLHVSESTVLEWRRAKRWPSWKVGRTIRFTPEHVEQIVAQHLVQPTRVEDTPQVAIAGQTSRSARAKASA